MAEPIYLTCGKTIKLNGNIRVVMRQFLSVVPLLAAISFIAFLAFFQLPQAGGQGPVELDPLLSQCAALCSDLIQDFRDDPDISMFEASEYCVQYFDTSTDNGLYVDHCYTESGDVVRIDCNVALLNGTTLLVSC